MAAKPKRSRRKKAEEVEEPAVVEPVAANDANGETRADSDGDAGDAGDGQRRSGWWQRTFGN